MGSAVQDFRKLVGSVSSEEIRKRLLDLDDEERALRHLLKATQEREKLEGKQKRQK